MPTHCPMGRLELTNVSKSGAAGLNYGNRRWGECADTYWRESSLILPCIPFPPTSTAHKHTHTVTFIAHTSNKNTASKGQRDTRHLNGGNVINDPPCGPGVSSVFMFVHHTTALQKYPQHSCPHNVDTLHLVWKKCFFMFQWVSEAAAVLLKWFQTVRLLKSKDNFEKKKGGGGRLRWCFFALPLLALSVILWYARPSSAQAYESKWDCDSVVSKMLE